MSAPMPTTAPRKSRAAVALAFGALLFAASLGAAEAARDTSVKVIYDGRYWFCYTDPTGISLAEFKSICQLIEQGGKGVFVEFTVDRRGKMRRKPGAKPKPADLGLRGTFA